MQKIVSKNPATGAVIQELDATPITSLPDIFARSRAAQHAWASLSPKRRATVLLQLRETIINRVDELVDLISQENGKPRFEAMMNDLLPTVQLITYFAKKGPKLLRDRRIPMSIMKHRSSYLNFWPLGVVTVISPWNYPFMLPMGDIVMALIAGNSVIFKPSEVTPLIGLKIQDICDEAGLPPDLIQTVIGDGTLGAALIQQKPNKIFFTGSVGTGKKVMAAAAEHLIPVNLELGGKDAMIVLSDADLDFTTSAALWGAFSNSGQVCASVERAIVHESVAEPFIAQLKEKLGKLRQGPSTGNENDLGSITFQKQAETYERQIAQAKQQGLNFVTGGEMSADKRFLKPTIVTGAQVETSELYKDETFGPTLAVTTFRSLADAVRKANDSRYGLLASVFTRNTPMGEQVAKQLEVGTVTINEVTYTGGLAETPWGGVKESGFGRTHSDLGMLEFVNMRHIHKPTSRLFIFKSPWWFPYTDYQYAAFRQMFNLYRRHWSDKIRAIPHFLLNLVQFIKREPRL